MTAIELPARWGDPDTALAEADALLSRGPKSDVVLLPEQSLTGYVSPEIEFDLTRFAEPLGGPTTRRLAELACAHGVHLVGPLVERDGDRVHNAMIAVAPDGRVLGAYRKRRPWYVETWAAPGEGPIGMFEMGGARCAIAICFDLHFLTADELREADLLLFPSAWVERIDSRPRRLRDLAKRAGVPVVNANWGCGVPRVAGQGASRIVAADGTTLALAPLGVGPQRIDATITARRTSSRPSP